MEQSTRKLITTKILEIKKFFGIKIFQFDFIIISVVALKMLKGKEKPLVLLRVGT